MTLNLIGQTYGRLTVTSRTTPPGESPFWVCACSCGSKTIVPSNSLRTGNTKSCGCLQRERAAETQRRRITHGHTRNRTSSPEYRAWLGIHSRCTDPNNKSWPRYGGRGITVCIRWKTFETFFEDMGKRPVGTQGKRARYSIDRINNGGNYEPLNCRWASVATQQTNRSNNRNITVDGVTHCLREWSRISGVGWATIRYRIDHGWGPKRAIHQHPRPLRSVHPASGLR